MKTTSILKRALIGLLVVPALFLTGGGKVAAAQIPWSGNGPLPSIPTPGFNVFSNIPFNVGDESDFVRLRPSNGNPIDHGTNGSRNLLYISTLNAACNAGDMYDVRTYVHNGADADFNQNGQGTSVAHNVNLAMTAKLGTDGTSFPFTSTITSSNAATVTDSGTLNCTNNVRLEIVPGTIKAYNETEGWQNVTIDAVNGTIKIGSRVMNSGDVWGCWDDRIQIVYTVKVVAIPPVPAYSCDLLTNTGKISDNKYGFKVDVTAINGAVLKDITYAYSDGTTNTDDQTTEHLFTDKAEKKTVTATANFTVGNETKSHTQAKCATEFSVNKPVVVVPAAAKPTALPKTGAASTLGIFGAVSAIGAFLHRSFVLRRD